MIPKARTGNWFMSTLRTTFFLLEMTHGSKSPLPSYNSLF